VVVAAAVLAMTSSNRARVPPIRRQTTVSKGGIMPEWLLNALPLPIFVIALALLVLLEPQRKKFVRNRKKDQAKPDIYHLT
jgi:hypothetical protein